jgi:hypothetical protein
VGFSPQAKYLYTDRFTAACRRSYSQLLRIEGVAWSAQRIPTAVKSRFSGPQPLLFHSSSSSNYPHETEWTPFQTHYFSENLVAMGIEPGNSGSVAKTSDQ